MNKKWGWLLFGLVIVLVLTGCSANAGDATPTAALDEGSFNPVVNATGMVVPAQWAILSAQTSAVVEEALVSDGEVVKSGQLLVKLSGSESARARVAAARLELADAQNAYDDQANVSAELAAKAQADIVKAKNMIIAAERALDKFEENPYLNDVRKAQKDVEREKNQLAYAQKNFDKYASRPETDSTRKYFADKLADQQRDYDAQVRDLAELENKKQDSEANLAAGQALLASSQVEYDTRKAGPSASDLQLVEARLENAKAQLESAQTAFDYLSITAPFDGIVSNPTFRVGELVTLGQPLMYISDPSSLQVETTDLSEIDVARLAIGDSATVTFDALPNATINGTVARIATKSSEGSGVNYTVVVTLDQIPEKLLWGMTAFMDISIEK
jgi:multidrug efflux pump subunit AcrA (membrane-fusion protein)